MSSELTDEQLDLAVAYALGAKPYEKGDLFVYMPRATHGHWESVAEAPPEYSTDLNAIDAAVQAWATTEQRRWAYMARKWAYMDALEDLVVKAGVDREHRTEDDILWATYHATARQRSEALLAAAGPKA